METTFKMYKNASQDTSQASAEVQDPQKIASPSSPEPSPNPQPPTMDYTTSELYLKTPPNDMITLEIGIGPSMISALIHRTIISEKSPILSILLNHLSDPTQPSPTTLCLAAEDPVLFTHLLTYIYTSSILSSNPTKPNPIPTPKPPTYTPPTINGTTKDHLISTFKTLSSNPLYTPFLTPFSSTIPSKAVLWGHVIEHPIDFTHMQSKLIQGIYTDLLSIDRDFELLYHNQLRFWTKAPQASLRRHQDATENQYVVLADEFRREYWNATIESGLRPKNWRGYNDNLPFGHGQGKKVVMPKTHLQLQIEKMASISLSLPENTLLELYLLASKYEVGDLQDHVVTSLISGYIERNGHMSFEVMEALFPLLKEGVPLRRFILKTISYLLLTLPSPSPSPFHSLPTSQPAPSTSSPSSSRPTTSNSPTTSSSPTTKEIYNLLTTNPLLGRELFTQIRGRGGIAFGDPRKGGFCEFHIHEGKCALGGNGERQGQGTSQGLKRKAREMGLEDWF